MTRKWCGLFSHSDGHCLVVGFLEVLLGFRKDCPYQVVRQWSTVSFFSLKILRHLYAKQESGWNILVYRGSVEAPVNLWDRLGYSRESRLCTEDTKKLTVLSELTRVGVGEGARYKPSYFHSSTDLVHWIMCQLWWNSMIRLVPLLEVSHLRGGHVWTYSWKEESFSRRTIIKVFQVERAEWIRGLEEESYLSSALLHLFSVCGKYFSL